jgi:MoaA/NifB/PqqE/SkfB family radical SAM enzyme
MKGAIRDAVSLGCTCIILSGGEPLLRKDICELVRVVLRHEAVVIVFTNGEYLNEALVQALKEAGLFGVFVSLDYPDASRHDANRKRKGLYEKAVQGLRLCQEAGILTGISTFASREKIANGELNEMVELAKNLGVLELFVFDIIATGRLRGYKSDMLGPTEASTLREFRQRYNFKSSYPRIIHQTMFTSMTYPCAAEGCPGGIAQMHLRGNGDVTPCDFTPRSFGNIRERTLEDIWLGMCTSEVYSKPSPGCRLADPRLQDYLMGSET